MNRVLFAITVALLSFTTVARADDASKHAKVKELFQLTYMENRMQQTKAAAMAQAQAFASQQLALFGLPENQNKDAAAYYNKLYALVATRYDWNTLEPAYEQIYVDLYTEQELDGILAFYKSPVGQALLSKNARGNQQDAGNIQTTNATAYSTNTKAYRRLRDPTPDGSHIFTKEIRFAVPGAGYPIS